MAERIIEVDYDADEIVLKIRRPALRLLSEEVKGHLLDASRDSLSVVRHLLDALLAAMEEGESEKRPLPRRSIDIE